MGGRCVVYFLSQNTEHYNNEVIAFPNIMTLLFKHFNDPSIPSPSTALRFSENADYNTTSKEGKLKVETVSRRLLPCDR